MSEYSVVTAQQKVAYKQLNDRLQFAGTPEFLNQTAVRWRPQ